MFNWLFICLQEKRLAQEIAAIEKDTGFKLRVLAQNYPDTPGFLFDCHHHRALYHIIDLILNINFYATTLFIVIGCVWVNNLIKRLWK